MEAVRIDKYLWAVRVFKSRTEATQACNGNKVKIGGVPVKPGKTIKVGDTIEIRKSSAVFTYRVINLAQNRMGAALVPEFALNLTPESEMEKFRAPSVMAAVPRRDKGAGRPTKKERRELDAIADLLD